MVRESCLVGGVQFIASGHFSAGGQLAPLHLRQRESSGQKGDRQMLSKVHSLASGPERLCTVRVPNPANSPGMRPANATNNWANRASSDKLFAKIRGREASGMHSPAWLANYATRRKLC